MITKYCNKCKLNKSTEDFNWKNREKGKLQHCCKECQRSSTNALYAKKHPKKQKSVLNRIPDSVLIDEEDREKLESFGKWYVEKGHKGYCKITKTFYVNGKRSYKNYRMHRVVMDQFITDDNKDLQIDHINGNRLDNRKENLRFVTNQENQMNKKDVKGFYQHKTTGKFCAVIGINGKVKHIGCYDTPEEAHQAYLDEKKQIHIIQERGRNVSESPDL